MLSATPQGIMVSSDCYCRTMAGICAAGLGDSVRGGHPVRTREGCRMQEAGSRMQEAGSRMQEAGCRMQDARLGAVPCLRSILAALIDYKGVWQRDRNNPNPVEVVGKTI